MVRIWEEMVREEPEAGLRPIIPLVLYHGRTQWHVHRNFGGLLQGPEELRPYWPAFTYELYDLTRYSDEDLVGAAMLQVTLQVMKQIFSGKLAQRLTGMLGLLQEVADVLGFVATEEAGVYHCNQALPQWIIHPTELAVIPKNYPLLPLARGAKLAQFIDHCLQEGLTDYLQLVVDIGLATDPEVIWRKLALRLRQQHRVRSLNPYSCAEHKNN